MNHAWPRGLLLGFFAMSLAVSAACGRSVSAHAVTEGSSAAPPPASTTPRSSHIVLVDLTAKFLTFYDSALALQPNADDRFALWKRLYGFAAVPPTPFGDTLARRLLEAAWDRYPSALNRIRGGYRGMGIDADSILIAVTSLLGCGQSTRVQVTAFVGAFDQNAFAYVDRSGLPTIAIPIESGDARRSLVHEFTHAVHRAAGCADIRSGYDQSLVELVISEGLAMRVVQALIPGRASSYYVIGSQAWLDSANAHRSAILSAIEQRETDRGAATVQQFTFGLGATGLRREAYYAGWVIVGNLLDSGLSLSDIARTPDRDLPHLVGRAVQWEKGIIAR